MRRIARNNGVCRPVRLSAARRESIPSRFPAPAKKHNSVAAQQEIVMSGRGQVPASGQNEESGGQEAQRAHKGTGVRQQCVLGWAGLFDVSADRRGAEGDRADHIDPCRQPFPRIRLKEPDSDGDCDNPQCAANQECGRTGEVRPPHEVSTGRYAMCPHRCPGADVEAQSTDELHCGREKCRTYRESLPRPTPRWPAHQ
jgi:hypothetical protein